MIHLDGVSREGRAVLDLCSFYVLQIGELVTKLPPEFKAEHEKIPWRAIANMRNRLVHGYAYLDKNILWQTVLNDVPALNEECRRILRALDPTAESEIRAELEAETIIYDGGD